MRRPRRWLPCDLPHEVARPGASIASTRSSFLARKERRTQAFDEKSRSSNIEQGLRFDAGSAYTSFMSPGTVELVEMDVPVELAITRAFDRLREAGSSEVALAFDASWHPTMDIVDLIADELNSPNDIE